MRQFLRKTYLTAANFLSSPQPGIHILNSHYVIPGRPSKNDKGIFEDFLKHLSKKCRLVSIQEATRRVAEKDFPEKEVLVAFTFDDGFLECYTIIAPLLEKYNCNAAFFVNANYIDSNKTYRDKFNERIQTFTKSPMSWEQIIDLHNRGHVIGSHTLDHLNMADLKDDEMEYQLSENKKILEEKLDCRCDYFAWPYGQTQHFPKKALGKTLKYHKYIFSGTNYKNYFSMDGKVINRRHIEPFWAKSHIGYFLSVKKT